MNEINIKTLESILQKQFPEADVDFCDGNYNVNSVKGWDSLGHFNLLLLIEYEYDIQFSDEEMSEIKDTVQIRQALSNRGIKC